MSAVTDGQVEVPREMWWFGLSYVAQGAVLLLAYGPQRDVGTAAASMVASAALGALFAHGVLRARGFRTGVVAVVVVLPVVLGLLGLVVGSEPTGLVDVAGIAFGLVQCWLLWRYTRTPWWDWQRTRPERGPSLVPLLAIAVLAGAIGGLADLPSTVQADVSVLGPGAGTGDLTSRS